MEQDKHQAVLNGNLLIEIIKIDGWLCGKPEIIYDVDDYGNIKSKNMFIPPDDVFKFKSENVASDISKKYIEIIEKYPLP